MVKDSDGYFGTGLPVANGTGNRDAGGSNGPASAAAASSSSESGDDNVAAKANQPYSDKNSLSPGQTHPDVLACVLILMSRGIV